MTKTKKITIWMLSLIAIITLTLAGMLFSKGFKRIDRAELGGIVAEGDVTDADGNKLNDGEFHSLPARMLFAPVALQAKNVTPKFTVNVSVTVTPITAATRPVDWSVEFVNPESEWASGKTVTDYVTVTPTEDGAKTAAVSCFNAFGEQIKLTVTARENAAATASCILDYKQQLISYDLSVAQEGKSPTVNTSRKTGKLVADLTSDNVITVGYSYNKSTVFTVALDDNEIIKPAALTVSYKASLVTALNNIKANAGNAPTATATGNGFTVTGFLYKDVVEGLSIENHNKVISTISSNMYSTAIIYLKDENENVLTKYTFDTDTTLVKTQGKIESISLDRTSFVFDESKKEYKITYLKGQSSSTLGLFEKGSEYGRSKVDGGVYPETYTHGAGDIKVRTLKSRFMCGGEYHSGGGVGPAEYLFEGWYLDWNLTQPFNGTISGNSVGDIVLYAKIKMLYTHAY